MDIKFDFETFTFSNITLEEFRAIQKFMDMASLAYSMTTSNDSKMVKVGKRLSKQIDETFIPGY